MEERNDVEVEELEGTELNDSQLEQIVGGTDPIELPEDDGTYRRKGGSGSTSSSN